MRNIAFLGTHYALIRELPANQQGAVYKAIFDYAMEEKEPVNLTGMSKAIFETTRQYWDTCRKQFENGQKGGRPSKTKSQIETQEITQQETQTETQSETLYNNNTINNNKKEKNKEKSATILTDSELNCLIENEFADEDVRQKFKDYALMRKAMGKNKAIRTQATFDSCVLKLREYAKNKKEALGVLDNSISNCYQGLFDIYKHLTKTPQQEAIPYAN